MESSTVLMKVREAQANQRRWYFKTITQSVIMAIIIQIVSLFLSALIAVLFHVESLRWISGIATMVSMTVTVFGLWVLAIWLDLK